MLLDFGWSELMLIGIVALVVIGPKDLPRALRVAGFWVRKARTLSREFQSSVEQMVREAELDEMRDQRPHFVVRKIKPRHANPQPRPQRADRANNSFRRAERGLESLQLHLHRQPVDGALQHQLPPAKLQMLQLFSSKHARSFFSSSSVAEKDDQLRSTTFSRQKTPMVARE